MRIFRTASPRWMVQQHGISLIELMISMAIGLLLIAGILALFFSNKQTYRYNDELARLQENSRVAIDRVERTLRMAGHLGCLSMQETLSSPLISKDSIVSSPTFDIDSLEGIHAETYSASAPGIVGALGLNGVDGTDMITVRYGQGASTTLAPGSDALNAGVSNIVITDNALGFTQGEPVVIADCKAVGLARISNVPASGSDVTISFASSGGFNLSNGFPTLAFDQYLRVMRLSTQSFFLAESPDTNQQGNPYNSLYLSSEGLGGGASAVELAQGVVDMIVTYGISSAPGSGEVEDYVDAGGVGNWNDVMAVNVQLLMSSVDENVLTEDQSVSFNGRTYTDRRMYAVVSTTVALRRTFD